MATAPQKTPTPEVKAKAPQLIAAVHGRMVDPLTAQEYTQVPSELLKGSSWVDAQIAAKKLQFVDAPEEAPAEASET